MNVSILSAGLFALASASAAVGAEPACRPVVESNWVRAAPPGAMAMAGYLVLRNPCDAPVEVVGVESLDFDAPMIHRTVLEDGVTRMRPAGELVVPAGGSLEFAPNGLHLMLMGPHRPLADGERARIRLVLADGRRLYAEYPVLRQAP